MEALQITERYNVQHWAKVFAAKQALVGQFNDNVGLLYAMYDSGNITLEEGMRRLDNLEAALSEECGHSLDAVLVRKHVIKLLQDFNR